MSSIPDATGGPSGGAVRGGVMFAACLLTLVGAFELVAGLTAIIDDEFYVVVRDYAFDLDVTAWGWIHLVNGTVLLVFGVGLFARRRWAGAGAIALAMLSGLINFMAIPYYPVWSILVIALNVWVIWSLTRPGAIDP
jgi:uncharacterized membrane protein